MLDSQEKLEALALHLCEQGGGDSDLFEDYMQAVESARSVKGDPQ